LEHHAQRRAGRDRTRHDHPPAAHEEEKESQLGYPVADPLDAVLEGRGTHADGERPIEALAEAEEVGVRIGGIGCRPRAATDRALERGEGPPPRSLGLAAVVVVVGEFVVGGLSVRRW